jgi:hypothetical protein
MNVKILDTTSGKLCWVTVNNREALALIQSLITQMAAHNPNEGRLESFVKGDVSEMSIAVHGEEIPQ